jgi:DNA-binding CsgD family transcriptional regulator
LADTPLRPVPSHHPRRQAAAEAPATLPHDPASLLQPLIRQILRCTSKNGEETSRATGLAAAAQGHPRHAWPTTEGHEVVFDVEVDGVRYRLLRSEAHVDATGHANGHANGHGIGHSNGDAAAMLSPREQEICRMIAQGHPNKTIAAVLDISTWTVGTYLRRIFARLNVGSRAAMVATLMENGRLGKEASTPPTH